jgi:hypothetical protein
MITRKSVTLRPIRPNAGLQAKYRAELNSLLRQVRDDVLAEVERYKHVPPQPVALDAHPLENAIRALMIRWIAKLGDLGENIARGFIKGSLKHYDGNLKRQMRQHGFTVKLQLTDKTREALQASMGMNVGLIRSIPSQYLGQVEKYVYEATSGGFDLATLTNNLQHAYGISRNRAKLIARDQANKANAVIEKARRQELGITKAVWVHSHAAKEPRQSHVKANGKVFEVAKGLLVDGEYIQAGEKINCFPGETVLSDAEGIKKLWRRWYSGELTELVMSTGKSIKATPNHPVLTTRGWVAFKDVNCGDYLVERLNKGFSAVEYNVKTADATFLEVFNAASAYIIPSRSAGALSQFHGDGTNSEVEAISFDGILPREVDPDELKGFFEFVLAVSDHVIKGVVCDSFNTLYDPLKRLFAAPDGVIRSARLLLALGSVKVGHLNGGGLRVSSDVDALILKAAANYASVNTKTLGNLKLANAGFIQGNNLVNREIIAILASVDCWGRDPSLLDFSRDITAATSNSSSSILEGVPLHKYKAHRVVCKSRVGFSGHVYNLHNERNWYSSQGLVSHNCGCVSRSIIEF